MSWAKLRFTPARARWVAHERWHSDQRGHHDAEGRFVLEIPYTDPRELMMDVLKFGADVEVLGPRELVDAVQAEVRRMASPRS